MRLIFITASFAALAGCAQLGPHVDRCEQHLNAEGRWVYAAPGCPQIGGGKSIALPRLTDSPPDKPDPKPDPDKPKDPAPDHPKPPKDTKPDKPKKDKKPKSDNSDSNGKGGNHHNRTDKPQGPKEDKAK